MSFKKSLPVVLSINQTKKQGDKNNTYEQRYQV